MVVRTLKERRFHELEKELAEKARFEPLSASCTVEMTVNGKGYIVRLQPEKGHKIAALEALEVEREDKYVYHTLLTKGNVLGALL